eukprot:TRINITY_DN32750_c0_g1_i1.p2 TRINITY_DN32750_c0_g1~~TRINITY_DN32750_c0_g1_i1.p2  ORF type:complete len:670 (+),score=285.92 TRINITY_DN32750_c0_g1_i1:88-2097(+)
MKRASREILRRPRQQRAGYRQLDAAELATVFGRETQPPPIEVATLVPNKLKTMTFQDSLPRLPIPKLEDTCKRYIDTVAPLLNSSELEKTKGVVSEFQTGSGKGLHDSLIARDKMNKHTSYISQDWSQMYLSGRTPLPLNWTPYLVFRKDPTPERNQQAYRTATFIHASLAFRRALEKEELKPEVFHLKPKTTKADWFQNVLNLTPNKVRSYVSIAAQGYPLDMSQFGSLFNTTRIPRLGIDELRTETRQEYKDHVVVFYKGHPFKVTVAENGIPIDVDQIAARLQHILYDTIIEQNESPVGALTSTDRNTWAQWRDELELDAKNKEILHVIDSAAFTVCLDDDKQVGFDSKEHLLNAGRLFLHGDAMKANRWWDKSFSLLVSRNGWVCCSFEHSWGDGVAVMRWANDVFHTAAESRAKPRVQSPTEKPTLMEFRLSDGAKKAIATAQKRLAKETARLSYDVSVYPELGKSALKRLKVSPDAFMQQAFQLGFRKLYNETRSTYESATTSAFKHGRTEAIRAATLESKAFVDAMMSDAATSASRLEALNAAFARHSEITKEAMMGKGVDRHLFALRKIAERQGGALPELFNDRGYAVLGENVLSTSTLYNDCLCLGGFGPVHEDGLGIGYSVTPGLLFMGVTTYSRDAAAFNNAVWESVDEMKRLIEAGK